MFHDEFKNWSKDKVSRESKKAKKQMALPRSGFLTQKDERQHQKTREEAAYRFSMMIQYLRYLAGEIED